MNNDNFFDLNENPKMPDVSEVGKALLSSQNSQPKVVIGNLIVSEKQANGQGKNLREQLEHVRRDTKD